MYPGGMPPTPQAVQLAGQKQNQQQYDPSKGPPVQNAASLHTPPPQLPSRLPQGTLPMASIPLALSQQAQLVENSTHPGVQVHVQAGGPVLAAMNPHTQLQSQLQQMQPGVHIQLQSQQQQSQTNLQPGQAVSMCRGSNLMCVFLDRLIKPCMVYICVIIYFYLLTFCWTNSVVIYCQQVFLDI